MSNSSCESRGEAPLASSFPFPGKLKSYRHQETGCSNPFATKFISLKLPFLVVNGIYSLLQSPRSLPSVEGNRTRKASAEVGRGAGGSCPHIVFTPGRTQSISNSRFAPRRAVLPAKRQKGGEKNPSRECPTAFTPGGQPPLPGTGLPLNRLWTHQRHHTSVQLLRGHTPLCSVLRSHE